MEKVVTLWPALHNYLLWVSKAFREVPVLTLAYGEILMLMKDDLSKTWWFLEWLRNAEVLDII